MARISQAVRQRIIDVAKRMVFEVQLNRRTGEDLYDKTLMLKSPFYKSVVFIDKVTGISEASGDPRYLKVAVHSDHFKPELVNPIDGIEDCINQISKVNLHHHSSYRGGQFRDDIEGREPYGMCYKVLNLNALASLLAGLSGRTG